MGEAQDSPGEAAQDDDDLVDEASAESFPASDAPGYRSLSIGGRSADQRPRAHRFRGTAAGRSGSEGGRS